MAFIGSMLGAGQTSDWTAANAPLIQGATQQQAQQTYDQAQDALAQQKAFVTATAAQNGLGNQSSVFNQLQGVANGTGPNPAQAMLAQATGANVANQAALMAGQRGAGANAGLIARQAGMQGGAMQQQAAGQGATMQANQSLGALGQLGGIAGQQVGQQANATMGYNQAAQGEQNNVLSSIAAQNKATADMVTGQNKSNADIDVQNSKSKQGIFGGLLGGAGSLLAHGGMIEGDGTVTEASARSNYADGGGVMPPLGMQQPQAMAMAPMQPQPMQMPAPQPAAPAIAGPSSKAGKFLKGFSEGMNAGSGGGGGDSTATMQAGLEKFSGKVFGKIKDALTPGSPGDPNSANFVGPQAPMQTEMAPIEPGAEEAGTEGLGAGANAAEGAAGEASESAAAASEGAESAAAAEEAASAAEAAAAAEEGGSAATELVALFAHGGKAGSGKKVPAMVSPGERYLSPKEVDKVAQGKKAPEKAGEKIKGKAKVKGDSEVNDVVPKTLEAGGIVLPKSVMESKHPHWAAHKFVSAILAKKNGLKR